MGQYYQTYMGQYYHIGHIWDSIIHPGPNGAVCTHKFAYDMERSCAHPYTHCYRTPQTGNFTDMEQTCVRTSIYALLSYTTNRKFHGHGTADSGLRPPRAGAANAQEPRPRYPGAA